MRNITIGDSAPYRVSTERGKSRPYRNRAHRVYAAFAVGLLAFLWVQAPANVSHIHKLIGLVVGCMTLAPWFWWLRSSRNNIPLLELISTHYFLIFCPPVFLGPVIFNAAKQPYQIQAYYLTKTLIILIIGFTCLLIGYYCIKFPKWRSLPRFFVDTKRLSSILLVYICLAALSPIILPKLPHLAAKIGDLLIRVNGSVATYALAVLLYSGKLSSQKRNAFFVTLVGFLLMSLSTGWLHLFIYPLIAFFIGEIQVKKRLPWKKIIAVCLAIVALQEVKPAFRQLYWGEKSIGGPPPANIGESLTRAGHWIEMATGAVDSVESGVKDTLLTRVDHLAFFGHVVGMTPEHIPYLRGYTYKVVPAMFVPRAIWPNKPSTMEMANTLAVKYGWLPESLVGRVAVSPGIMDEAYMNFGIVGVALVMLFFGCFLKWMTVNLGGAAKGFGWQLVLVGFVCGGGIMVTWTAQSYLGGLWQTLAVITVLYWPFRLKQIRRPAKNPFAQIPVRGAIDRFPR
jgi:hypothetical protein